MAQADIRAARPLSPHLSVFRPLMTMVMSIVHRITGCGLYFGTLILAWWLLAIAAGPDAFFYASWFFSSWIGVLFLFVYTWILLHHMLGGIRHLYWDTGAGFDRASRNALAWATLIGSISLTIIVWIVGILVR
ncbi:succinate dehydrogenase subunit C [Faunimonas pinastri]|uniref:Succinate dehydrogenase cytochrome b556 subunit n=1 Tax=Faunimonas pinastri TaxID=1855383 RepID=A0A1H9MBC5_9HYPH|nr:succinate dehydrogenase, cytochrome b556 subunit [Faunimonas pinastri]SER20996.1 succinate dehydrogenase subunit C [Faunimonas pinastri]